MKGVLIKVALVKQQVFQFICSLEQKIIKIQSVLVYVIRAC